MDIPDSANISTENGVIMGDERGLIAFHPATIDKIFSCDKPAEAAALYLFLVKTSKWQKTNIIKANDHYIKKSLKWGLLKVQQSKKVLFDLGLVEKVQRRKNGKVEGWYLKINFLVSEVAVNSTLIEYEQQTLDSTSRGFQQVEKQQTLDSTCGKQETDALKLSLYMLKDNILDASKKRGLKKEVSQEKKSATQSTTQEATVPSKPKKTKKQKEVKATKSQPTPLSKNQVDGEEFKTALRKLFADHGIQPTVLHWKTISGSFEDYWIPIGPTAKGKKIDWLATFRNHVRRDLTNNCWRYEKEAALKNQTPHSQIGAQHENTTENYKIITL